MNKIITHSFRLHCSTQRAFVMFTDNTRLTSWLTQVAEVEPVVGGTYELFWNPKDRENNSTIGCKITAIEQDKFLAFEWKGPSLFNSFMNNADPLTHVVVYLIHSGWGSSAEWEKARQYFDRIWKEILEDLRAQVNG